MGPRGPWAAASPRLAVDGNGNIFVADTGNNAVKEIVAASGYTAVQTLAADFNKPTSVALDAAGDVFVADTGNNAVKKIVTGGGRFSIINTLGAGTTSGLAFYPVTPCRVADTRKAAGSARWTIHPRRRQPRLGQRSTVDGAGLCVERHRNTGGRARLSHPMA